MEIIVASKVSVINPGREEFTVQGMTGVEVSLEIAGPGSRSYAFIIDWHIRLVVAISWIGIGMLTAGSGFGFRSGVNMGRTTLLIFLPAAVFYLLYHPVVELLMHGQTPGKRMAGVRVVNRDGGPPGAGAILIRNAFRLVDSLPFLYAIGLICTFVTSQRVRIGDMAAGTLLVTNDSETTKAIDRLVARGNASDLDPSTLDVIEQLLERWNEINTEKRGGIARALLQKIDTNPRQPLAELSDASLRQRLLELSGIRESR